MAGARIRRWKLHFQSNKRKKKKNEFNSQQVVFVESSCDGGGNAASDCIQYKAMLTNPLFISAFNRRCAIVGGIKCYKSKSEKKKNELKNHILSVIRIIILSHFSPYKRRIQ